MTEALNRLQLPAEYIAQRQHLFPSQPSFDWFVRRNRDALVQAGAMLRPTGRWLVQPDSFDQAVLAIGTQRAKANP
jgi:hypothetical protein